MLDHISDPVTKAVIPMAVITASLLGSAHCVSMCGGLVMVAARDKFALGFYHLGRLLGYCALGAFSGFMGSALLGSSSLRALSIFSSILLGCTFIFLGLRILLKRPLHIKLPSALSSSHAYLLNKASAKRGTNVGSFSLGILTALLPCGWLFTFVLAGIASQSAVSGALVLLLFWLGTLPALTLSSLLIKKVFQPIGRSVPGLSGLILIAVGLFSVGLRSYPLVFERGQEQAIDKKSAPSECPMHKGQDE
ncbi:MAG: sulfite exporter TauE/SafE family protein [Bdellovibrionota bacterium]